MTRIDAKLAEFLNSDTTARTDANALQQYEERQAAKAQALLASLPPRRSRTRKAR